MARILYAVRKALSLPIWEFLKRILYRIRNRSFKPYLKKKNYEGIEFNFLIGDIIGREWYDPQHSNPVWFEMQFIKDYLIEQGDIVLECGGHHGFTTILLANLVGSAGKVVTFEPLPANCDIIERNIQKNGLKNVILERKAVGAEHGTVNINNVSNSSVTLTGKGLPVELTCLDEYAHLNPTFLKIDVEGFEMQVLQGAKQILLTRPKLAIEIHTDELSKYGASVGDLFRLISAENYKLWIQWEDVKEPEEYDMRTPIESRVHLFGIPLAMTRAETK